MDCMLAFVIGRKGRVPPDTLYNTLGGPNGQRKLKLYYNYAWSLT